MKIKLKSKRCSYEIDLHEKYTIITGDSGAADTDRERSLYIQGVLTSIKDNK